MEADHLRAVIVKVTRGDEVVIEQAFGESMDDVPATTDMNFRNGAVAFSYVATLLMIFVDEGLVTLDDTIDQWMPTLPEADTVTLRMLTNQTTGYPDFETDPGWNTAFNANPFHIFTFQERLDYAFDRPLQFAPGANWSYAHTNFMILGEILALDRGKPLDELLQERVLDPMGLTQTVETVTSEIPSPVLHTFSSERRVDGYPATGTFYEEATFWNPQWGTPMGANQTTTIDDMITTAQQVGTGALVSQASYEAMTAPSLIGFGTQETVCEPSCFTQSELYNMGLGVVLSGPWILQDPLLSGIGASYAYLPSEDARHRRRHDVPPRSVRRPGQLSELQRLRLAGNRHHRRPQQPATAAAAATATVERLDQHVPRQAAARLAGAGPRTAGDPPPAPAVVPTADLDAAIERQPGPPQLLLVDPPCPWTAGEDRPGRACLDDLAVGAPHQRPQGELDGVDGDLLGHDRIPRVGDRDGDEVLRRCPRRRQLRHVHRDGAAAPEAVRDTVDHRPGRVGLLVVAHRDALHRRAVQRRRQRRCRPVVVRRQLRTIGRREQGDARHPEVFMLNGVSSCSTPNESVTTTDSTRTSAPTGMRTGWTSQSLPYTVVNCTSRRRARSAGEASIDP